ncbi:tail fiber assembly protein [Ensifer sp. SSB1]|jgi:hypothetical protein|uniref:tail fiber assembly protein n=1 Tax=Ensifer sp. SSB1 TaxID=2795385 RepID=UPI001A373655|nr:tail fiber assembly protein [Ensifer sp. SSB1]MBK5570102.1 tail fiber assembly protein [Ensifer sp. SSB1]
MEIFNYHPMTGEFLSAGVADENQLDPSDPIVPGYATRVAMPAGIADRVHVYRRPDGSVPQNWPEGNWSLVPDYRRVAIYRTADGSEFEIGNEFNGLGELPQFLTDMPRPTAAHVWSGDSWVLDAAKETAMLTAEAMATRARLLGEADQLIAPLMDGFVLDELTAEDSARLKALSQYRKDVRAVSSQAGFPRSIAWPVRP